MNIRANQIFRNISYALSANLIVLIISVILNLFIPKFVGLHQYSMWQLYLFYSSFTGFFPLGWIDGISLKYAGEEYEDFKSKNIGTQYWTLLFLEILVIIVLLVLNSIYVVDTDLKYVYIYSILSIPVLVSRGFILVILQSTNRIKEYANLSRNDRFIYISLLFFSFILNIKTFHILVILDLLSKFVMLAWGMYTIRDILFSKLSLDHQLFNEVFDNIRVGSSLMFSNIASLLIPGIPRWFVERKWDVMTFGKLSLTLNVSNLFMVFINAVGIVLFPILRRVDVKKLNKIYLSIRYLFVPLTYLVLILYFPIKILLNLWIPNYSESMFYMGILFPMVVYEGRVSLLINTFLKTIREEKKILFANIITLGLSSLLSFISIIILENLTLSVVCIMFTLFFRCVFLENFLFKKEKIEIRKTLLIETVLTLVFVFGNIFLDGKLSFLLFSISLGTYIIYSFQDIKESFNYLKILAKNSNR